jgi:hypothetical protein
MTVREKKSELVVKKRVDFHGEGIKDANPSRGNMTSAYHECKPTRQMQQSNHSNKKTGKVNNTNIETKEKYEFKM